MRQQQSEAVFLLCEKQAALAAAGISRYPQRSDFTDAEVMQIKAQLGPWPRALEAAGIKPPRADDHAENQQTKRIAAKRKRTAAKSAVKKHSRHSGGGTGEAL